ncbi:MAG: glycosyltransferase family A protein [Sphingomicrobium sp.]
MTAVDQPGPVSVVIPTYNHARYLGGAIDSVLAQTVVPAEIIVIDDGSTDRPEEVVAHYPSVRLIRQDNRGLAAARNTGWHAATNPYVTFLDADDLLRTTALEVGLGQFERHPAAALNYAAYANLYWPSGRTVPVAFRPVPEDGFAAILRVNPIGMHGTVLYRRTCLEAVGGFAEELAASEDYELYLRLAARFPVACSPEVLADYRQHDSNMSRDQAFMLRAVLRVARRYEAEARKRGLLADYRVSLRDWKIWYVENWAADIGQNGVSADRIRQGLSLLWQAPVAMTAKISHGISRRLRREA